MHPRQVLQVLQVHPHPPHRLIHFLQFLPMVIIIITLPLLLHLPLLPTLQHLFHDARCLLLHLPLPPLPPLPRQAGVCLQLRSSTRMILRLHRLVRRSDIKFPPTKELRRLLLPLQMRLISAFKTFGTNRRTICRLHSSSTLPPALLLQLLPQQLQQHPPIRSPTTIRTAKSPRLSSNSIVRRSCCRTPSGPETLAPS